LTHKEKGVLVKDVNDVTDLEVWYNDDDIEEKLVKCDGQNLNPLDRFTQIKVEIIDLPRIYHYDDPLFDELFIELSRTEQYSIFEKKSL
jgi:hypothetical protein